MKILMVCLGNICRSPLAEGILRSKLENIIPDVFIDSAGTIDFHQGSAPDDRSVAAAAAKGLDISSQCSRKFRMEDFEKFDFILAMDRSNKKDLLTLAKTEQ